MKNKLKSAYRKSFSHTPYSICDIDMLSDESYRNKKYNFHFISSASLSLISSTFFIGLLGADTKSISSLANIEILIAMLSFAISLSVNSFSLFMLLISSNNEIDKIETLITLQYKFFAKIKVMSFISPVIGMMFLISYFNEYIAIAAFIIFMLLFYYNGKATKRAKRKAIKILK